MRGETAVWVHFLRREGQYRLRRLAVRQSEHCAQEEPGIPCHLLDIGVGRDDQDDDRVLGEGGGVERGGPRSEAGQTWNGLGQARAGGG